MKDSAERLVKIYNEIDKLMGNEERYVSFARRVRELSERTPLYAQYRDDLMLLAEIRNLIVHNTVADLSAPVCYPNEQLLARFEDMLLHISSPESALDTVAVTVDKIYSVTPQTRVTEAVGYMHIHGYSHAPVMEDGRVIGIFSEQSVFAYTALNSTLDIGEKLLISDLSQALSLAEYKKERYCFVGRNATVYDVFHRFEQSLRNGTQTRVIFITDSGSSSGKLLGMVTPLNLLNYRR